MATRASVYTWTIALSISGVPENTKILMRNIDGRQGKIPGREGYYTANVVYKNVLSNRHVQ